MAWRIEVKPTASKQFRRLDARTRQRIKVALRELEEADRPLLRPQVRGLTGKLKGDFRMRVGGWRILLTPNSENQVLVVYAILPRGDAY